MFIRNKTLYAKKIKRQWFILEPNKKMMRELNEAASTIWEILAKPHSINEIIKQLCLKYDVEPKQAKMDVETFIKEYVRDGFVKEYN